MPVLVDLAYLKFRYFCHVYTTGKTDEFGYPIIELLIYIYDCSYMDGVRLSQQDLRNIYSQALDSGKDNSAASHEVAIRRSASESVVTKEFFGDYVPRSLEFGALPEKPDPDEPCDFLFSRPSPNSDDLQYRKVYSVVGGSAETLVRIIDKELTRIFGRPVSSFGNKSKSFLHVFPKA